MRLDELDYDLPAQLIAQRPAEPRDASRLLCLSAAGDGPRLDDRLFVDLPRLLRAGDVLVRNDSRVLPARVPVRRDSGGRSEVLFLEPACGGDGEWEALVRGRVREGESLRCAAAGDEEGACIELRRRLGDGRWLVRWVGDEPPAQLLARHGVMPLPPYIKERLGDPERYQTTYARAPGSAAAPTAGLHFTAALDQALRDAGVEIEHLTLHVGLATFRPVTTERVEDHPLHDEPYAVELAVWRRIRDAAAAGRRVVAVGTTSLRLLEELARADPSEAKADRDGVVRGRTGLFITPGFRFRLVRGLLTNFHLPRTSLLALVMAFAGIEPTRNAYAHAVAGRYRFYSFGDGMLAWRGGEDGP